MKVNFNPDIELLIREVKMLKVLGYSIPSEIEKVSETGKKFLRQAKSLEQVATYIKIYLQNKYVFTGQIYNTFQIASFHNTIGDRMIPSQRPMMLSSAVELSKLVNQQQSVKWTDIHSVDNYIHEMRKIMEKISVENQTLANYHQVISNKVNNDFFIQFSKVVIHIYFSFLTIYTFAFHNLLSFPVLN